MTKPPSRFKRNLLSFEIPPIGKLVQDSLKDQKSERGDMRRTMFLNWEGSPEDYKLVIQIAVRGCEAARAQGVTHLTEEATARDIMCAHLNGCPLKLMQFLMADATDFRHDFVGIGVHLDRTSGKLLNDFKPIFAETKQ